MKVYYAYHCVSRMSELAYLNIESLYDDLQKRYPSGQDVGTDNYLRCYAAIKDLQNTFVVRSPIDFRLTLDYDNQNIDCDRDPEFVANYFNFEGLGALMFGPRTYLFSETPLTVTQQPAYFHDTPYSEGYFGVTASFDISKWFRPNMCALLNKDLRDTSKGFEVKRGDPLYYLKFNTEESVEVVNFSMNDRLLKYSQDCHTLKNTVLNQRLAKVYDMFMHRNYNKKIMKEIRKEL